jgi:hypothetical protein
MANFQARYGDPGWQVLVPALRAADPVAALTLLRIEPRPGPIAFHAQHYLELHQGIGKNYQANRSVLGHMDHFLEAQGILSTQAITPEVIERWAATTTGNACTRMQKGRMVWHFFNHLLDLKVMSRNPVSAVLLSLDRRPGTLFKPFIYTKQQVEAILEVARQSAIPYGIQGVSLFIHLSTEQKEPRVRKDRRKEERGWGGQGKSMVKDGKRMG